MISLPKTKDDSRIGILGGSFDPPHLGHQILALCALALENIEQLWVIPCGDHPFSKKLSPFEDRFEMCRLAFETLANVHVVGIENELSAPSYTVKTLEAIRKARPSLQMSFVMGSDVYLEMPKWRDPDKLAELCRLVVFLRQGSKLSDLTKLPYAPQIHGEFVLPHVKSTLIRESIKKDLSQTAFVDRHVLDYVLKHGLY